mgnify:CR=1 FL=1
MNRSSFAVGRYGTVKLWRCSKWWPFFNKDASCGRILCYVKMPVKNLLSIGEFYDCLLLEVIFSVTDWL